jgi:hypothetical protein
MAEPNTLYVWKDGRWISTGGGSGGGAVYEQDAEPTGGTYKDGDLWLSAAPAAATKGVSLDEVNAEIARSVAAINQRLSGLEFRVNNLAPSGGTSLLFGSVTNG